MNASFQFYQFISPKTLLKLLIWLGKPYVYLNKEKNAGAKARTMFNHTRTTTHMWTCRCTIIMV